MTKARDLSSLIGSSGQIDNTKITLDANEIPALDTAKITTGTFADARISQSSVSQHATSFDDNKIVNDISTLALRQASDQNKSSYNTNSSFVDVFQDATGIDTTTNSSRNVQEYVDSSSAGTPQVIDYTDIDGQGTDVEYKVFGSPSNNASLSNTTFQSIDAVTNFSAYNNLDAYAFLSNTTGTGGHMCCFQNVPKDTTDRTTYGVVFDFKGIKQWGGTWYIGKQNGYGDMRKFQILGSLDDVIYTPIDLSGTSATALTYSDDAVFSGSKTGGELSSQSSDGTFILNQHNGQYFTSVNTVSNFPTVNYRYLKFILMNQYSGTANSNAGFKFNCTFAPLTTNATGNFTGTTITAPSSVSSMGAIITYQDNVGTNALNTDIVLELSADGGSNWSTATLSALPNFSTGIKMAKVNDLAVTAGTNLKYKLSFANQASGSKEARIRGVALQY